MGIAGTVPRSRHFVNIYFYINMSKFQIVVTFSFRLASRPSSSRNISDGR